MTPATPPGAARTISLGGHILFQRRTYTATFTVQAGSKICVRTRLATPDALDVFDAAGCAFLGVARAVPSRDPSPQPPHTDPELPAASPSVPEGATVATATVTAVATDEGDPDFYLGLASARIVATEALLEAGENIADTIDARAMSCIYGDAGLGKTFSVRAALKEVAPDLVLLLQFRSRPTPRDIRMELFDALHLEGKPPACPSEFDQLLKRCLARRPYVLVCDEAQQFSRECFEFIRHRPRTAAAALDPTSRSPPRGKASTSRRSRTGPR